MIRRKDTLMGCLPIAGSGSATYGGGDCPGPGGPQFAIHLGTRELPVPA